MAVPYVFKLSGFYGDVVWFHDSNPTPVQSDYFGLWTHIGVSGQVGGWEPISYIQYLSPSYYAPNVSSVAVFFQNGSWYSYGSPGLYTGTAANPTFIPGVFNLAPEPWVGSPQFTNTMTLTVHPVAPAPLAGAGLMAALAALAGFAMARPRVITMLGRKLKHLFSGRRLA